MPFDRRPILAAARRFLLVVAAIGCPTVAIGALVALLTSASFDRAISLGLYGVGSFCVAGGFAVGTRGPFRRPSRGETTPRVPVASVEELKAARSTSGLLVTVGLLLLAIGTVVDSRFRTT